jgi:hypothetical protein
VGKVLATLVGLGIAAAACSAPDGPEAHNRRSAVDPVSGDARRAGDGIVETEDTSGGGQGSMTDADDDGEKGVAARKLTPACWAGCNAEATGIDAGASPMVIPAAACGAIPGLVDVRAALQKAIDVAVCETKSQSPHASVRLVLGKGEYRIGWNAATPAVLYSLVVKDSEDLTIDGDGASLVFTNPSYGAMLLTANKNLTMQGFSVDYALMPFTQGTITAVDGVSGSFTIDADPAGSRPDDASVWRNVVGSQRPGYFITDSAFAFVAVAGGVRQGMGAIWLPQQTSCSDMAVPLGGDSYRIYPKGVTGQSCEPPGAQAGTPQIEDMTQLFENNKVRVGNQIVLVARGSQFGTFDFKENENVTLTDLKIYASPGGTNFGWEHNDGEVTARKVEFRIKPGTSRLISANGDGFNTNRANRAVFDIQESVFEKLADDAVNLNTFGMELNASVVPADGSSFHFPLQFPWYSRHFRAGDVLTFAHLGSGQKIATPGQVVIDRVESPCATDKTSACYYLKAGAGYAAIPSADDGVVMFDENVASKGSVFSHNELITPRGAVTISSPETKVTFNKGAVVAWFLQIPMDLLWRQGPFPYGLEITDNDITVVDPQTFASPAVIYSFQRGTTSQGPFGESPKEVTDIWGLKLARNKIANVGYTVTPVKTRNARPAAGQTFWLQADDGPFADPYGPRSAHRVKPGDDAHYCTFTSLEAFEAAGGTANDPYVPTPPSAYDGPCAN